MPVAVFSKTTHSFRHLSNFSFFLLLSFHFRVRDLFQKEVVLFVCVCFTKLAANLTTSQGAARTSILLVSLLNCTSSATNNFLSAPETNCCLHHQGEYLQLKFAACIFFLFLFLFAPPLELKKKRKKEQITLRGFRSL